MLEFKQVSLKKGGEIILNKINFTIDTEEMVAILGDSGAGKSSIFKLLIAEELNYEGIVSIDNFDLKSLSFKSIQDYRRQIGIIFQDFKLLPGKDVWENIAYPLEASQEFNNKQAINKLINFVGLQGKERSFPSELSGGEQQRVAIARALVHEPKVIIADEPSGNLDRRNTKKLIELFQKIYQEKGTTIIFATHDHFLVKKLNPRVIEIINGEIVKN